MIGLIDEHAPRQEGDKKDSNEYTASAEEKNVIKRVRKWFDEAKEHRSKYDHKWLDYYKFFRGRQWKDSRPSYRHSEVVNFIFQAIQASVPIITDKQPRVEFLPQEPQDRVLSDILNEIKNNDWEAQNWLHTITEVLYDAHIYGIGYAKIEYDASLNFGLGGNVFESVDPFYCFPDPSARDVNQNGDYFIHAEPMDLSKIKKKWPKKAKHIKPDLLDVIKGDRTDLSQMRFKSPTDNKTYVETDTGGQSMGRDQALVITCYYKDESFDEKETEEGYEQKLKYPRGRKTVIVGNIVLEDVENPYEDGQFPYLRLQNYILPREFFGISEVEQLESPQKTFNMLVSYTLDVLTLMGNPIWIVDENSGVDVDNIYNRPGLIIEKHPGTEVRRESGVQLQPFVINVIDRMQSWFNEVSGSTDVSSGAQPGSVRTGNAIQALQDAAQTRLRLKSRLLDGFLSQLSYFYISRVFQFYTVPRVFKVIKNDAVPSFFKFTAEPSEDGLKKIAKVRSLQENENGEITVSQEKEFLTSARFDIKSSTGSGLPFAKSEKANLAFNLYDRQIIDAEEVLKAVDYPNKDAVLERMRQKAEVAAEAQLMAAQQAGEVPDV